MKKTLSLILVAACLCSFAAFALGDAPAAGSLSIELQSVRGNTSWTPESYPEVWITPLFAEYIIQGDKEDYPAKFLHFAPPEGAAGLSFDYDDAQFLDHDRLIGFGYYAYDRTSFEVFLEKAEEDGILADGSDGVAMFVNADSNRARAMVDIKDDFGKTAKLVIDVYDYSRDLSTDDLKALIQEETTRVTESMQIEELDGFWSDKVFASVQLYDGYDPILVTVDTSDLTVITVKDSKLKTARLADGKVYSTQIAVDSYSYAISNIDDSSELTLADGTEFIIYTTDYKGYAATVLMEEGRFNTQYLTFEIDCADPAADFPALLQEAYDLLKIEISE